MASYKYMQDKDNGRAVSYREKIPKISYLIHQARFEERREKLSNIFYGVIAISALVVTGLIIAL